VGRVPSLDFQAYKMICPAYVLAGEPEQQAHEGYKWL
jgi:hypothetical protein